MMKIDDILIIKIAEIHYLFDRIIKIKAKSCKSEKLMEIGWLNTKEKFIKIVNVINLVY